MITFAELKNKSSTLYPAILLERYSRRRGRRSIRTLLLWALVVIFVFMVISPVLPSYPFFPQTLALWLSTNIFLFRGAFFLVFSLWAMAYLLKAFHLSYYFRQSDVDFDVARLAFLSDKEDITKSFIKSIIGEYAVSRLGLGKKSIEKFLESDRVKIRDENLDIAVPKDGKFVGIKDYGHALYYADKEFHHFLNQYSITEELFLGALEWIDHDEWAVRDVDRWWTRERLSRIQSIGRNWSFGKTYTIEKFGTSIFSTRVYIDLGDTWRVHRKDVEKIESVLVKNSGANVMLVTPTSEIGLEIVASLGKMIASGMILSELEDKRLFILDTASLLTESSDKEVFKMNLIAILAQANEAGNVILVFSHTPEFIEGASTLGIDVAALFSEVLTSSNVQIISIASQTGFHESIETNKDLMQHFEKISIKDFDQSVGLRILQEESHRLEFKYGIFFTYQSLLAIVKSAERFFVGSTYSDKILDLIQEVANKVKSEKKVFVTADDVDKLIAMKTGIPQGKITEGERENLATLEESLHKRVVGQNEAIEVISDAMRRGRAGITNPKRPIGSFLFLGPTGVGKTETTKALAASFFDSEENIIRLDMSEYTGEDAVDKLIGSIDQKETGVLAQKILDKQYGVLLLDELEKATPKVLDLFLQILDEGRFTDVRGQSINARNLIIVATSNAGSDMIYNANQAGEDISKLKEELINKLINDRIFRPEFLNRFDGVILFNTLSKEELKKIAILMLKKLDKRLSDKSIKINVTDDLLDYLIEVGSDRKFGARSMNRAIQDEVEVLIADKIISGEIGPNSHVEFIKSDDGKLKIKLSNNIVN